MNTIKLFLKWSYGLGFALMGLIFMITSSIIGGLLLIIAAIFTLPPTLKMVEDKIGRQLERPKKYFVIIMSLFIGFIMIGVNMSDEAEEQENLKAEEFEKLPQHVKDSLNLVKARLDSVDRVRQAEQRLAEEKANRKELVEKQFSAWDGSHPALTRLIKQSMNDPDSYEHMETRFRDDGNTIFVITKFRGANAFGAKVINSVSARVDFEGNVIEVYE